ncbi:MAG: citrate synthase, partial [Alphaproteobacteria bacterium]|nr:citrate synthase [Alphaproteobacteria bacterium]
MTLQDKSASGLDGVIAAETALSHVDGVHGELIVAGARIDTLAFSVSFEELAARLWSLADGQPRDPAAVARLFGDARQRTFSHLPRLLAAARDLPVAAGLRAAIAALGPEPDLPPEIVLSAAMPVITAALLRVQANQPPIPPDSTRTHAADLLCMLRGSPATPSEVRALQAYLVTVCDHGMNASTFAGRVIASTGADLFMAVTGAYCALTGPLHGGAPEPVLAMLNAIATAERIAPWIDGALSRGERLMGFGHRVYRVRDPRADVLKDAIQGLGRADLGFAAQVEAYARAALAQRHPQRPLDTNVEFYTAILLDTLQIPRHAFTGLFACARTVGWT